MNIDISRIHIMPPDIWVDGIGVVGKISEETSDITILYPPGNNVVIPSNFSNWADIKNKAFLYIQSI
jgi:hypothetical protein